MSAARAPWLTHFGLTATPFTKSVPAADLYPRPALAEAVARINFVVASSGLGIVVGDVGVGKTVALRAAVASLDPLHHHLIYLANPPALGTRGLHVAIVSALGVQPRFFRAEVAAQAAETLAAEEAERHRRVILAFDEAHLLSPAQLEEIRLLTNQNLDAASPFAGLLIGQPTLLRQLRMGVYSALDQRISMRFAIPAMDVAESGAYLAHHLKLAGRRDPVFAEDAVSRLHRFAGGIPRALNNGATAALVAAASAGKALVDDACAKAAVAELTRE